MGWFSSDAPAEEEPDEYAVVDEVYGGTYPPPASPRTHAGAEARPAPDESQLCLGPREEPTIDDDINRMEALTGVDMDGDGDVNDDEPRPTRQSTFARSKAVESVELPPELIEACGATEQKLRETS